MNKSWKLIPKILSGEKSIESRWYQTRRAPWNKIDKGDKIFFKNSGEPISAQATVSDVRQFKLGDISDIAKIIKQHGKEICLINNDPETWDKLPKYCILLSLENSQKVEVPFQINKEGFGSGAAWIIVEDINKIKIS
ncbi:MAG: hypothetical protein WC516_01820 [Patescibacteria group bacterium]